MLPQRQHLLVIGAPRSGTTLLATMIGRHTDVGMLNEDVTGGWIDKVLGKPWSGTKLCVPNQIQLQPKRFFAKRLFKNLGLVREAPRSARGILEYLAVPELKIVAIIRDGNDAVASMMKRGGNRFAKAARRWGTAVQTIYTLSARYPDRVLVVSYEQLVLSPETVMRAVCAFLQLPLQAGMLDGHKFNPYYPQDEIDRSLAYRQKRAQVDLHLEDVLPDAVRQYDALMAAQGDSDSDDAPAVAHPPPA